MNIQLVLYIKHITTQPLRLVVGSQTTSYDVSIERLWKSPSLSRFLVVLELPSENANAKLLNQKYKQKQKIGSNLSS